jgi:hypothetical protein
VAYRLGDSVPVTTGNLTGNADASRVSSRDYFKAAGSLCRALNLNGSQFGCFGAELNNLRLLSLEVPRTIRVGTFEAKKVNGKSSNTLNRRRFNRLFCYQCRTRNFSDESLDFSGSDTDAITEPTTDSF